MLIQNVLGSIQISEDVLSKIIGLTTISTNGIASMSTGIIEKISNKVNGKSLQNGVELRIVESGLEIHLKIIVYYGVKMHEVCRELQHNVREAVEKLTGLSISTVNVKVQNILNKKRDSREKLLNVQLQF
ncbi:Alkaline shock protein 23 [compost metagenome]